MYVTTRTDTANATVSTGNYLISGDETQMEPKRIKKEHTGLEVKGHRLSNDPAKDNQERGDEESNLDAGADGHAHSQVHLVADGHHDSRDVLSSVAHYGNQYQTYKGFTDTRRLNDIVDAAYKVVGADGNQNCRDNEDSGRSDGAHRRLLLLALLRRLALGIEQVAVSPELEDQEKDV